MNPAQIEFDSQNGSIYRKKRSNRKILLPLTNVPTKVLELKVCIFSHLFTFPVAKFCQILKKHLGKELCPGQGSNPGPLAYEASVLTILPRPLHNKSA